MPRTETQAYTSLGPSRFTRPFKKMQQVVLTAIAEFVVLDLQPFNVVTAPSFQRLLQTVSANLLIPIPSRPTVVARVEKMKDEAVKNITVMLEGTRPGLTTDIWTANDGVRQ